MFFTTVENEDGSSMPVLPRITVYLGSACLARWGQSAARTMRQRQQRIPTSVAESLKTSTGLASELGSCFPAQVSRNSSMSSSMSQRLVWVDLEVGLQVVGDGFQFLSILFIAYKSVSMCTQ